MGVAWWVEWVIFGGWPSHVTRGLKDRLGRQRQDLPWGHDLNSVTVKVHAVRE